MTAKTVAGVIKDAGNIAESTCSIKLDPVVSLGDTYKGAEYIETCNSSGNYSMTVPVGNYNVSISYDGGAKYTRLGAIQVVDDTPSPTTLAILLGNVQIPTNAQGDRPLNLLEFFSHGGGANNPSLQTFDSQRRVPQRSPE
ncbi:MAG: hypothetical protein GY881_05475 [Gammaproteobacteria bacterium]|nr:hypothetical protein [Gammaproteobacteria bacterium]